MWVGGAAIGTTLLVGIGIASAQTAAPAKGPTRMATVDGSGRVVPLVPAAPAADVIGQPTGAASPCRDSVAMAPDAARALVARVATQENFYPDFVLSVAKIESRFVSTAVSDKGAVGLMQLTPETARRFNVDPCNPEANIRGGVRFLRLLHERYRNPFFILAAYNAGEDAVQKSHGVPPYPETVRFIADVMNDFYVWPNPAGQPKPPVRASAPAASDIIETTASPAPAASAVSGKPSAGESWSDGFVMHVD
jgi:hypothetical protein